ncbi:MAG: dihydroorotase [Alphaproteobacteria bacterium]
MPHYNLIIKNGTIVSPTGQTQADIAITNGKITAIGDLSAAKTKEVFDAKGLHILPGVIDTQVHFREPGATHKEDLHTGTKAAVMGGVTAIFEMPNTHPSTLFAEDLHDKIDRALGKKDHAGAFCDFAFFIGASDGNIEELKEIEKMPGCAGVKIFMGSSTGSLLVSEDSVLKEVLDAGTRRVAIHCEDEELLNIRKNIVDRPDPALHPIWRDEETAINATKRILKIARETGRPIHVLHVTTAEEMEILKENKDIATVEVTPNHLSFFAPDCYNTLGSKVQQNPPIRDKKHQEALWEALREGIVDVIGTDHAPHTLEEKAKPYPASPSGMPGVQTLVPIMLNHVAKKRLSLERFVDLTSASPARIYGIKNKGHIAEGFDADFTIVDLKRTEIIQNDWIVSKCGWTPFQGQKVKGWPVGTMIRGKMVMQDGKLTTKPSGQPVLFT